MKKQEKTRRSIVISAPRVRATWAPDAPIHYPKDAKGRPLYKVTVGPRFPDPWNTNTHEV